MLDHKLSHLRISLSSEILLLSHWVKNNIVVYCLTFLLPRIPGTAS